jgi:hypothetical protein
MTTILILGSGPAVTAARAWRRPADRIVAINNAWAVRPDWDDLIHPWDFTPDRLPPDLAQGQRIVTEDDFVPSQNAFGGFVYAGATMAFTAGYWALHHYRPATVAFFGCDMTYAATGQTHFYGTGTADPLRADITLQSLEAKSARLMLLAAREGCAVVNLSMAPSRLVFPRRTHTDLANAAPMPFDAAAIDAVIAREAALGYTTPTGRYWEEPDRFDPAVLRALDGMWLEAAGLGPVERASRRSRP